MAKARDRFRVGQRVRFSLDKQSGHSQHDGKLTTVLRERRFGVWTCSDPSDPARGKAGQEGWRYTVWSPYGDLWHVEECHLRPLRDDAEKLSTWTKFVKAIGVDPRQEPAAKQRKEAANG